MKKNNYFFIAIIWLSSVIGWFINYLYHPIMLNFMSIEAFWIFWSLVWLFNILWVLTSWFDLFLNKEFSKNLENKERLKSIYFDTLKIFSIIWILVFLLFVLFSPIIADFIKVDSIFLVILTWVNLIFAFFWIATWAISKSLKLFEFISLNQIISPIIKLSFWVLLVYLWFWIYWAIVWFLLTWVFSLFFITYFCFKKLKQVSYKTNTKDLLKDFFSNKKEIINFFFISLFFAIFMNIDVILVRNIFPETEAWIYVWISVLWKFLIFLLLSIETVYFWQIMEFEKSKLPNHLIKNPLFLMLISWSLAIIINLFFWEFFLSILKKDLVIYKDIFLLNLWYFSLLAFVSFFIKVLIWWKSYKINYICLFLVLFLVFLVYSFWKTSLFNYALSFLIFWFVSILFIWSYFLFVYRKK